MTSKTRIATATFAALSLTGGSQALADSHGDMADMMESGTMEMMDTGLMMPQMDAARGRVLFAEKGCVVCHSVNGVGGEDASMLDAEFMDTPMNPFEFAARMWRGAESMVILQRETLGEVIDLSGEELADIIAFTHDSEEQAKFTQDGLSPEIAELLDHTHEGGNAHGDETEAEQDAAHDNSDGHHDE